MAGLDELGGEVAVVNKSGTAYRGVQRRDVPGADFILDDAGGAGEEIVGRNGPHEDKVQLLRGYPQFVDNVSIFEIDKGFVK